MKAMVFKEVGKPLTMETLDKPTPGDEEVLIRVDACAVCRTDLHIIQGDLTEPKLPLVLGHQIVGTVEALGKAVKGIQANERVGVPWLGKTCGSCEYCKKGSENLCDHAKFTGYDFDGGYAQYCTAHYQYTFPLSSAHDPSLQAPLLCGGLIGFRALRLLGDADKIGFYGFGAAAHLLTQLVVHQQKEVYAFTRPGDFETQEFAKSLGVTWTGGSDQMPPTLLDGAILFAPVGDLYIEGLKAVKKGGTVISAGIHMSPIPSFNYDLLWGERVMRSVANLTRDDGDTFLGLAEVAAITPTITTYDLKDANQALEDLASGKLVGSAVLKIPPA